jgi:hypothetical protein
MGGGDRNGLQFAFRCTELAEAKGEQIVRSKHRAADSHCLFGHF